MYPYIDIHTHRLKSKKKHIHIRSLMPSQESEIMYNQQYSMAIHPWYLEHLEKQFTELEKALQEHNNIIAIGELGIDKVKNNNQQIQRETFEKQVVLSEKYQKPLILHSVKSHSEILHYKKQLKPKMPWVIHAYEGNKESGLQLIRAGLHLSIGEAILKKEKLRKAIPSFPIENIFLETDVSDVSIEQIYKEMAKLKDISLEELMSEIEHQFKRIFRLGK